MKQAAEMDAIQIVGAAENNLKHIDLTIPKGKLVVLAGVSGSGKSSLAFDTIAVESSRQWQSSYPLYVRNRMPHYERPKVDAIYNLTPSVVVDQRAIGTNARSTVGTAVDAAPLVRLLFSRIGLPSAGGSMAYSFNHPLGMCPDCTGLGERLELDEDSLFNPEGTICNGGFTFSQFVTTWQHELYQNCPLLDPDKKLKDFSSEEWAILRYGTKEKMEVSFHHNSSGRTNMLEYDGAVARFRRLYLNRDISKLKKSLRDEIMTHVRRGPCSTCGGTGLNPKALASEINGRNIINFFDLPVCELLSVLQEIKSPLGAALAGQIAACLERMVEVGIGYLSLSRRTDTLSGGEIQRLKLVRNLGSSLSNITYIFDEPTAGLHPADADRIGRLLLGLRDQHNNVLVVEHSRQMMDMADHIIELGPLAGTQGGQIVYEGSLKGLYQADTATAQILRKNVTLNPVPLSWTEGYEIKDAHRHNLKHISVTIPKGVLTAITGVAGSGKSSLACQEFAERYPEAIVIDQKPIGTSIRSTPATYTGVMDEIRKLFSRENGVKAQWFSFNSKGACPVCKGKGEISYEVAFADPVVVLCEECQGRRYNPTALSYTYHGKNIEEVMALTIEQAVDFFPEEKVQKPLQCMLDVGLGYMTLGQPTSTLSGGEIQRIKLASELHKEGNIYILDEPSIGLHNQDVEMLLSLLRRLVAKRNTVIIIEHRLELISQADWIIDLGPGGGNDGGQVLFCGTPDKLLDCTVSKTGSYLKNFRLRNPDYYFKKGITWGENYYYRYCIS